MNLAQKLEKLLTKKPYISRTTAAKKLGTTPATLSTTANRAGIKFMSRKEVEAWIAQNLSV